jgi:imidazolonepropionase-like amidohydrolase
MCAGAVATWNAQPANAATSVLLFEGGRLITDLRRPPIESAAFIVENGHITTTGIKGALKAPPGATRIDFSGKTVMPALIDAHVHLGYQKDLIYSADNFTRENLIDQLNRYAYSGVAAILSLGTDPNDLPFEIRAEQEAGRAGGALYLTAGRGIATPNAGPNAPELKPSAYGVSTEEEARRAVREQVAKKVAFIKIWVDDRNGTVQKLSPALSRAIIDEAHKRRTRVIAHVYYLDDAKELARAGIDGFAHLVRDREMDDEVIALIRQHNVVVIPNLALAENTARSEPPSWLNDSLFQETTPAAVISRIRSSYAQRSADAVQRARETWSRMQHNLARLNRAHVNIAFGADSGAVRDHFHAYTDHRELQLMVESGMTPAQALQSATITSAEFLHLNDRGALTAGKSADLVMLDGNPLEDIRNTTRISRVWLRGQEVDRQTLRNGWLSSR